jgi:peptide/nickel transport system ATP-binding protein/oligopeptide transport system ATP-binding protein
MKSLRVRNLRKRFAAVEAVRGVDLDLLPGETLALVGESGSGKSTIARLVLQLVAPDAGSIELDGQSLVGLRGDALRAMRRRLQMIFQDPYGSLDPTLSIRQVLAEPFRVHFRRRPAQDELERLLGDVGLSATLLDRMPHELSGGQRQRVAIARALAVQPEFIACDEVVSALDVSTRAQILTLLRSLQKNRRLSMLFITHDLAIVPYIAQRVAVIHRGEIVERGNVDEIFSRPQHAYTQALLAAVPIPDPRARRAS